MPRRVWGTPVDEVDTQAVLGCLNPIWRSKPETASRLRGRIEAVLDYAKAHGWRSGENPAAWRGHLALILPRRRVLSRGHHAAMVYGEIPEFIGKLRGRESMTALALEFAILTAARSGEVLGARWSEFDLGGKVWTIPAARMKAGCEHRVPLSSRALAILEDLAKGKVGEFVFAGQKAGNPLSGMAMAMTMRRMGVPFTVHGFRNSFRDWAGNESNFPRELAEAALAHSIGNAVEAAYRRSDALERRRDLMAAWEAFCCPAPASNVVPPAGRPI